MIEGRTVLGLITARGGSKGLPRKNPRLLGGKPLIAWTIEEAQNAVSLDRLILSSDDLEIIETARRHGCEVPFVRPAELATDSADSLAVVRHALASLGSSYDYVVLLQPTSPFRTAADIEGSLKLCHERGAPACVSVVEVSKTPYWMFKRGENQKLVPLFAPELMPARRQDAPPVYALNGAVFVAKTGHLVDGGSFVAPETVAYVMDEARSVDIDTEDDLALLHWKLDRV